MKITTADFIKNYGTLAEKALVEPVTITKNGRDDLVVLSVDEYARLKRRDRRVVRLQDFTDEEMALMRSPTVPPRTISWIVGSGPRVYSAAVCFTPVP